MSGLLRFLSLFSLPVSGVMFFMLARKVGQEQPSRMQTYVMGVVMPSLMMAVNMVFMLSTFIAWCPAVWVPIILAGFGFGYLWGGSSKLYRKGDILVVKRTVLHLGFWVLSYCLTQLLATALPASIAAAGLATMFFSTGSAVGTNTNLILRQRKLDLAASPVQSAQVPRLETRACPKCKALLKGKYQYCIHCRQPLTG